MKIKLSTTCFDSRALPAADAVFAANGAAKQPPPLTIVKESAITTNIKARLAGEMTSRLMLVKVATDRKGSVVLSGKVRTQEEADKAVSIARAQEGVTSVENEIQIS